jgi:endonuclease/exonuclease/phosphatase family metal-dependent hydrolase
LVRIATFNILHGRSPEDGRVDVDRLAKAVRTLDADVLGLQEVDRDQPRSLGADLTAVAAEAMGAVDSQFVAALSGTPGGTWMAATGEEQPPLRASVPLWSTMTRRPFLARDEPRVAVAAVLEGPSGQFTVCNTHLSFIPGWNATQLRRLVRSLTGTREPLAVIGDLNMQRRHAARVSGLRPIASAATFPAHHPHRQLDHVLVRGALRATGTAEAVRLPLSDHRALVVDCELA